MYILLVIQFGEFENTSHVITIDIRVTKCLLEILKC